MFFHLLLSNADQADADGDGVGDVCDIWLELKKAEVEWHKDKIKIDGKLALPVGKSHQATSHIGTASIQLPDPLGQVVNQSVNFVVGGHHNEKWKYKADTDNGIKKYDIHWEGAKFEYKQDIHVKSEYLGDDSTTLEIHRKNITNAFTISLNNVTINVDAVCEDGTFGVTILPPDGAVVDIDDDGEIEVDILFGLTSDMTLDISGAISDTVLVSEFYTPASAKFKIEVRFDAGDADGSLSPPTLSLEIKLGEEDFTGNFEIGSSDWKSIKPKEWKYKREH